MIATSLHRYIATFLMFFIFIPFIAFARTCEVTDITKSGEPNIKLQVAIGEATCVSGISEYISTFYNFFVGAVATLAIFMIVIGGVRWLFARGNPGKIGAAKKTIESAIMGMLLVFVSVALLRIINPDLISLKLPKLKSIQQVLFYDTVKCEDLPDGTMVWVGPDLIPVNKTNNPSFEFEKRNFLCMEKYNIEGTKQVCRGNSCVNPQNEVGACTTRGCLYGGGFWGTISWDGNFYTDEVQLLAVCPDYSIAPMTDKYRTSTGNRVEYYLLPVPQDQLGRETYLYGASDNYCPSQKPIGYLLGVQVNDADPPLLPTIDDDIVFDKTCKIPLRSRDNPDRFASYSNMRDVIPMNTAVFSLVEVSQPQECNIEIRYSGSYAAHPPLSERVQYKEEQWKAATNDLKRLLIEMNNKQSLIITSISDDNIYKGTCKPWENPPQSGDCQHTLKMDAGGLVISAHYGGPKNRVQSKNSEGYSCAADVKPVNATSQTAWDALSMAATGASFKQCERAGSTNLAACDPNATHLHISVAGCGSQ